MLGSRLIDRFLHRHKSVSMQRKPFTQVLLDAAPRHADFTIPEIGDQLGISEDKYPKIRTALYQLITRGLIVRTRRSRSRVPARYARPNAIARNDNCELSMVQFAHNVLSELGPMSALELAVEMLERGYEPSTDTTRFKYTLQR